MHCDIAPDSPRTSLHTLATKYESEVKSSVLGLEPAKDYIYTHGYPLPRVDWADLPALQADLPPTSAGYYLVKTSCQISSAPRLPLQRGILYLQKFSVSRRCGIVTLENLRPQKLSKLSQFQIPSFSDFAQNTDENLEKLCENILNELAHSQQTFRYLNITAHYPEVRENFGLPRKGLQPGPRLLKARKHLPGIQSEFVYLSPDRSAAAAHEEDFRLPSANVLYGGAPKLWTIIHPSSKDNSLK